MEQLKISPAAMLEDEITWLDNFEPTRAAECETSEADNVLLAGHLRLIKTLLSLCGTEKEMLGNLLSVLSCVITMLNLVISSSLLRSLRLQVTRIPNLSGQAACIWLPWATRVLIFTVEREWFFTSFVEQGLSFQANKQMQQIWQYEQLSLRIRPE